MVTPSLNINKLVVTDYSHKSVAVIFSHVVCGWFFGITLWRKFWARQYKYICQKNNQVQILWSNVYHTTSIKEMIPHMYWPNLDKDKYSGCRYNAINFLQNIHKRHPIARPIGPGMGCLLWVQPLRLIFCPSSHSDVCNIMLYLTLI